MNRESQVADPAPERKTKNEQHITTGEVRTAYASKEQVGMRLRFLHAAASSGPALAPDPAVDAGLSAEEAACREDVLAEPYRSARNESQWILVIMHPYFRRF